VRQDIAKELVYTARVVSGREAVELGLATHLSDTPREAAFELAREIAGRSPHAVRAAKVLLERTRLVGEAEALRIEEEIQRTVIGSPNQLEAVRANMEKREPEFEEPK
jgi:enoyl-CoA hydratase/carnithine racemase